MSIAPSIPVPAARPFRHRLLSSLLFLIAGVAGSVASPTRAETPPFCAEDQVLASGPPDPALFSRVASRGVVAEWCEGYDELGQVHRAGPYRERHANGRSRVEARYVDGRLDGPILAFDEDGFLFVRGALREGRWVGALSLLLPNGTAWFDARYVDGRLEGPVALRHPDGALAAETRFRAGREQGLARSFYPTAYGNGLLSEVRVANDEPVGPHRVFDEEGTILAPLPADHPLFATVERPPVRTADPAAPTADATPPSLTPVASITTR